MQREQWPTYTYIEPQVYTRGRVRLIGLGTYVPANIITNDFFAYIATRMGSPRKPEDLERVTGLERRYVCASTIALCRRIAGSDAPGLIEDAASRPDESLADMAVIAAQRALRSAGIQAQDIDVVLAASSSDNYAFPTLAGLVQERLGCRHVRAQTFRGACACDTETFQSAIEILAASNARRVLIITSEAMISHITHILDWKTSSLFGEGAAALVLERGESAEDETFAINGYDASQAAALYHQAPLRRDAAAMAETDEQIQHLYQSGRAEEANALLSQFLVGYARMNGKEVYREAPRAMAECVDVLCRHAQLEPQDIAYIIPHQPNARIISRIGDVLINSFGWPSDTTRKLINHFRYFGNLSNASIGMALAETVQNNDLQPGQWMVLPAAGGGMHYGAWLLRYQGLRYDQDTRGSR